MRSILDEMRRIQRQMDSLFDEQLHRRSNRDTKVSNYKQPPADVFETDEAIVATIELPGVNKDDINVQVTDDGIEVQVEKEETHQDEREGMYRFERKYDGFYRHVPLPRNVEKGDTDATYKNGVLELRIPKRHEDTDNTTIEVS